MIVAKMGPGGTPTLENGLELTEKLGASLLLEEPRGLAAAQRLWEQRPFLLKCAVRGLLVSAIIAFLLPNQYRSSTRLMPPDSQTSSGMATLAALTRGTGDSLGFLAGDLLGIRNSGALFIGILRSRSVEDRLVDRFDLQKLYGARRREIARQMLERNTVIVEDRLSGIITVTVTDQSPQGAAALAQGYVEELNRRLSEVASSAARRERVFLEERLKVVKQELDQAAQDFSRFASENTTIDLQEQSRAMVNAAARLQGELIAVQAELKGLEAIYTPNNVRVRAVQARITELEKQLRILGGQQSGGRDSGDFEKQGLYPSLRKLPVLGVTYSELYRRTKIQEAVFEVLTKQYEMAKVQEAKELPSARVLDPAEVPERKSGPIRGLIMFFGVVLSFVGGVVWLLGVDFWKDINPDDRRKQFLVEIGGTVKRTFLEVANSERLPHWATLRSLQQRLRRRRGRENQQ